VFLMILGYVWVMVGAQGGGYVSRRIAYCSSCLWVCVLRGVFACF